MATPTASAATLSINNVRPDIPATMIHFYAVPAAGARLDYSHDYTGAMGWWQDRVLPRMVDNSLSIEPIMAERRRACAALHGRVVELGFGSGLNIAALPSAGRAFTPHEPPP